MRMGLIFNGIREGGFPKLDNPQDFGRLRRIGTMGGRRRLAMVDIRR